LRRAFFLGALTAIKVNPLSSVFMRSARVGLGKKLIVACARKLAVITWAVLYYNKPFDASEECGQQFHSFEIFTFIITPLSNK
jgi:hypothetical protein